MNARKGLRKYGLGGYFVSGPKGVVRIERERRPYWRIYPAWLPIGFHYGWVRGLAEARANAEWAAGVAVEEPDTYPEPHMPMFLRRWQPRKAT